MSRDIGNTQQAILDELSAGHLAVIELAERLDASYIQIRRAVHALADRGLVDLYKVTHQLPNGCYASVKLVAEKRSHWPHAAYSQE
jgi:predicted transcriptional regulator